MADAEAFVRDTWATLERNPDMAAAIVKIKDAAIDAWHRKLDADLRTDGLPAVRQARWQGRLEGLTQALALLTSQPVAGIMAAIEAQARQSPTPPDTARIPGVDA